MLHALLFPLSNEHMIFNVFRYITFRTIGASLTAIFICFVAGPWFIRRLAMLQWGQVIRADGPDRHQSKKGTPTAGGTLIVFAMVFSTLLWMDLSNRFVWIALGVTTGYGLIGFLDDYLKISKRNPRGLRGLYKMAAQLGIAFIAAYAAYADTRLSTDLYLPFFKNFHPDLGALALILAVLVMVGSSNAVNLTDGLDGLAIGPVVIASMTLLVFAYVAGHRGVADYLQIPYVAGSGELAVFCGTMAGAGLGFLWFNTYPAQVFMGDVGSLALGGALGSVAVVSKNEILLALVGGLFVVETLSVIVQVLSYKLRGKRVFLMAPIHHHFELKGLAEPKIIVRAWIISIMLAMVSLATLKLR